MDNLELGSTHCYIVQPISYVEIADNVSPENSVKATCGGNSASTPPTTPGDPVIAVSMEKTKVNGLNCWLYTPENAAKNMPLIVYLHGITGKGNDLDKTKDPRRRTR